MRSAFFGKLSPNVKNHPALGDCLFAGISLGEYKKKKTDGGF
jgi:hypothetical protein